MLEQHALLTGRRWRVLAPLLMREQLKHARRPQVAHQQVACLSQEVVVLAPLPMREQPKHARRPQVAHKQVACCGCAPVQVAWQYSRSAWQVLAQFSV